VYDLRRYVLEGNETDYTKFVENLKVPLGDGKARRALDQSKPDITAAAHFFLEGQNDPEDIPGLIKLFTVFRRVPFMDAAIRIWHDGDEEVDQLKQLGWEAHLSVRRGTLSQGDKEKFVARIDALNDKLIFLENTFSRTLGAGTRWVARDLLIALLLSDLAFLVLGSVVFTFLGRSVVKGIDRVGQAVDSIAEGNLAARCVIDSSDELARLAKGVNQMASNIENTQQELRVARDSALQSTRLKSEFLANMSHEIRTPLNVVLGYTDLLGEEIDANTNEDVREHFDAIRRAGTRLYRTIEGILDFSKIEAGAFEVHRQPIQLPMVLDRHVQDLQILAARKDIQLRCIINERKAAVLFDESCLTGALTNLLQNAIKFTNEGFVTARLYRDSDGLLKMAISDTGIGIEPSYLPHLWEPFSQEQTGYTRAFEGNGLGLALTKRYLELNGATLEVESRKAHGSTFTISFAPSSEITAAHDEVFNVAANGANSRPSNGKGPCVLVVEDDLDNQNLMRTILSARYDVLAASSAYEVRKLLAEGGETIELIIMDFSLHGKEDGVSLARSLHTDKRYANIPIVALTAHASTEDRKRAMASGFAAFLSKPVDRSELFQTLSHLLTGERNKVVFEAKR
ncbi:MAG TPA: ATP-binding protein, partial [Candidatus Binataceae bacterium]|nr:ATP-binding protein [Candidatus Binataceae bacterium]